MCNQHVCLKNHVNMHGSQDYLGGKKEILQAPAIVFIQADETSFLVEVIQSFADNLLCWLKYTYAPLSLSGAVQLDTVQYAIICISTVKGYQITVPYHPYFSHPFLGVPAGPKRVHRGRSFLHCCPLTASRQKAVLECSVQEVLYIF